MLSAIERNGASRKLPAVISLLSDAGTPVSVFHKLTQEGQTAFLFESTEGDGRLARYSFIGVDPVKTISFQDGMAILSDVGSGSIHRQPIDNPLSFLRQLVEQENYGSLDELADLPFTGGLVGYLGYAATGYFDAIPQQVRCTTR